ncbi:MAG: hypothetical protein JW834_00295, partial [Candidatus Diapherotrites archaeon]|nr:hypothetical protein [Candidatus Diapherotrites archaeon]
SYSSGGALPFHEKGWLDKRNQFYHWEHEGLSFKYGGKLKWWARSQWRDMLSKAGFGAARFVKRFDRVYVVARKNE